MLGLLGGLGWLGLGACGTPPGSGPRETGEVEESEEGEAEASDDEGPEPVCVPGSQRCGDVGIETCAATGLEWSEEACPRYASCTPCIGDDDPLCEGLEVRCTGPCDPDPDAANSAGCSFVTVWLPWYRINVVLDETIVVVNPDPSRVATVSLLQIPNGSRDEAPVGDPIELAPGESASWVIEAPPFISPSTHFRTGGMWRIVSDLPLFASQEAFPYTQGGPQSWQGASLTLLPELSFRGDFVVPSAEKKKDEFAAEPYFVVIALEDDTELSWVPTKNTSGDGAPVPAVDAGEEGSLRLNRYDQVMVHSKRIQDGGLIDLSGTRLHSDKAVAAFSGVPCAQPVLSARSCDPLMEQLIPIPYWGRSYVVPPPLSRSSAQREELTLLRLFAADGPMEIRETSGSGQGPWSLDARGDFVALELPADRGYVFESESAFMAVQYLDIFERNSPNGVQALVHGDTAMAQAVPTEQYLEHYAFATSAAWGSYALVFVRAAGGPEVELDGVALSSAASWSALGPWEWAVLEYPAFDASHLARSEAPFGLSIHAFGDAGNPPGVDGATTAGARPAGLGVQSLTTP